MEQKIVKVPFNVELAKKITNGEVDGRIVTREGGSVRVVCWDVNNRDDYVLALLSNDNREYPVNFMPNGRLVKDEENQSDLILEIPEYVTFKEGDVIVVDGCVLLFSGDVNQYDLCGCYCSLFADTKSLDLNFDYKGVFPETRLATEEEKQKLINALKASKEPKAKEYLKMLGIKVKPEFEFTFRQIVLVRCDGGIWSAAEFSHKNGDYFYMFGGIAYKNCIPYNDQTKHLLGTTDNWEE